MPDRSARHCRSALHCLVLVDRCMGLRFAGRDVVGARSAGDCSCRPSAGKPFAPCHGTDVAGASQRGWRARATALASQAADAAGVSGRAAVVGMSSRRANSDPRGCTWRMVPTDSGADVAVVCRRATAPTKKSVPPRPAATGVRGIRCVVGKIQRFQVTKIQGDTLQVKNP